MENHTSYFTLGNVTGINTTTPTLQHPVGAADSWGFTAIFSVASLAAAAISNGAVLLAFIFEHQLRTAFNIYLINLLFSNIVQVLLWGPYYILTSLNLTFWADSTTCALYNYGNLVGGVAMNSHVLIAINRIWAMTFPFNYRIYHTRKAALGLCVGMWIYVHIFILPNLIIDAAGRVSRQASGCNHDDLSIKVMPIFNQIVIYDGALLFLVLSYPFIFYKRRKRLKVDSVEGAQRTESTNNVASVETGSGQKMVRNPASDVTGAKEPKPKEVTQKQRSHGFLILTLLTCSVIICWTPTMVFFTSYLTVGFYNDKLYTAASVLFALQAIFDPILFSIAVGNIRDSLRKRLLCFY